MKKWKNNITNKYVMLESSGQTGFRYHLYGLILRLNKRHEARRISKKWFWFYERFHLPPYWWRTKTFKIITAVMLVVTIGVLGSYFLLNNRAEQIVSTIDHKEIPLPQQSEVSQMSQEVESSADSYAPPKVITNEPFVIKDDYTFLHYDLSDARQKNGDTVGWLEIQACGISYPVVQTNNNDYYLNHDFNKRYNFHGWIFGDFRNRDYTARNTVIYGHNLMIGGMFSNLSDILSKDKPVFVCYQTFQETLVYEVVSVYVTEPVVSYIQTDFSDDDFKKFEEAIVKANQWGSAQKQEFTLDDKFLTLSTCYGDNRLAVHCRLVDSLLLPQ